VPDDSNKECIIQPIYLSLIIQSPMVLVQAMFDAFSASAALNPDHDVDDDGMRNHVSLFPGPFIYSRVDQQGEWIYNDDEVQDGAREVCVCSVNQIFHDDHACL
jgi:hypothetical protein